jgi:hypothetical protein
MEKMVEVEHNFVAQPNIGTLIGTGPNTEVGQMCIHLGNDA